MVLSVGALIASSALAIGTPALADDAHGTLDYAVAAHPVTLAGYVGPSLTVPEAAQRPRQADVAAKGNSRSAVIQAYRKRLLPLLSVPVGWTGSIKSCRAGTTSAKNKKATLAAVNYFRSMNNLAPVKLNKTYSRKAQAAALISKANGYLTHYPQKSDKCYTKDGFDGASHSNIYLSWGYPGPLAPSTGPRAVVGYMRDEGANNTRAGHRHWILYQGLKMIGSGDTDTSNALYVVEPYSAIESPQWVTWPTAGYFPRELEPEGRWSIENPHASFAAAKVKVATPDGPVKVKQDKTGQDSTLTWDMKLPSAYTDNPSRDYTVTVTVSGISIDGKRVTRTWRTTLVRASR